jgi:hypothetical protein
MRWWLFNIAAAVSLLACFTLAFMRLDNSFTMDGSFALKSRTNPYFHRGYHSFWVGDVEVSYAAGIGGTGALPLAWVIVKGFHRSRTARGFEITKQ